jgi:hypothetical protein
MSAAAGVLDQYSAAAGAVEFLFTFESVQRNNENLQVTMDGIVRIVRRRTALWSKSRFSNANKITGVFQNQPAESALRRILFLKIPDIIVIIQHVSYWWNTAGR